MGYRGGVQKLSSDKLSIIKTKITLRAKTLQALNRTSVLLRTSILMMKLDVC